MPGLLSLIVPLKVNVGTASVQDLSAWLAGLTEADAVSVSLGGALQVSAYVAGPEAAATGLVTTRTAWPLAGSLGGVIVSGATAIVPGWVKVRVAGAEFVPVGQRPVVADRSRPWCRRSSRWR